MDSARWQRLQQLFHDATALPAPERRPMLERACGDDRLLFADALAMLEEDERADSLLDRGVDRVAHGVLDAPWPHSRPRRLLPIASPASSAKVAWAWSIAPSGPISSPWSPSKCGAMRGCRRRGAIGSRANSERSAG